MFDAIEEGITVTDLNGCILEANLATVRALGYSSKEELIGHCGLEFISKRDRDRCANDMMEAVKTGQHKMAEYTFIDKDGREYDGWASGTLLRDSSGEPMGFLNVSKTTTKPKASTIR